MTEKVVAQFKKLLLARRLEVSRNLAHAQEEPRTDRPLEGPDCSTAARNAPSASLGPEFHHETAQASEMLMAMDAALARIAGGTFGECMTCGEEIGSKRLVAFPWTRYCLACQATAERRHRSHSSAK